jgi:hypothetical protein
LCQPSGSDCTAGLQWVAALITRRNPALFANTPRSLSFRSPSTAAVCRW